MAGELLLQLAAHLVLTALPAVAAVLFLASRGERRVPVLLAVALAASGLGGLLGFWIYYGSHLLGQTFTYLLAFGSALAVAFLLHSGGIERPLLRRLATPLALWALGSAFLIFLGFLHGGTNAALGTSSTRFDIQLPSDNDIPLYFAEFFYTHSHHGTPPEFPGEWLASDRPPLQVGYVLSQQPFAFNSVELNYEVLAVCLQQLWIVGLWALLVAAEVGRRTKALAMITVLVSDLAIVHGFFVWPKLLPAAMLLGAAALLMTPIWKEVRSRPWGAALVAVLLGLAMMGHGSSVFAIIPLALFAAFRGLPSWRWLAVGLAVLIVVLAPWSAYQKWGDPPGNRLLKWQIGGSLEVDSRGTLETIEDSYSEAGIGGTIHNKAENVVVVAGGGPEVEDLKHAVQMVGDGNWAGAVQEVRSALFYYFLPAMGLLLLGPIAMLIGRRRRRRGDAVAEWNLARDCLIVCAIGLASWCLLMFGNGAARTVIHQGSYFLPIAAMVAGILGLRAVVPRLGAWIVGIWAVFMLGIYVPELAPPEGTSYSLGAILFAALFLAGYCWLALRGEGEDEVPTRAEAIPAVAIDSPA
jgi:hypothetical protein